MMTWRGEKRPSIIRIKANPKEMTGSEITDNDNVKSNLQQPKVKINKLHSKIINI